MGCQQSSQGDVIQPKFNNFVSINGKKLYFDTKKQIIDMSTNDHYNLQRMAQAKFNIKTNPTEAQNLANFFFAQGYIDQAIQLYECIITQYPNNKTQVAGHGNALLAASHYEWYVYKWYKRQIQLGKLKYSPFQALSLCYYLLSRLPKYLTNCRKGRLWYQNMVKKYPTNYALVMGYANILSNLDSYDQAIKYYDKAIQLNPNSINAHASKGMIYAKYRTDEQKSLDQVEKIHKIEKDQYYAWMVYAKNFGYDKEIYQTILEVYNKNPEYSTYPRLINMIGCWYSESQLDYSKALEWYVRCIQIAPNYANCYNNIALDFNLQQNIPLAKQWFYKAIQIQPDLYVAYQTLYGIYKDEKASFEQIQTQLLANVNNQIQISYRMYGQLFLQDGLVDKSIEWIHKATLINPTNPDIWNSLAITYLNVPDYYKSIQYYSKAFQCDPQFNQAYKNCAYCYEQLGDIDKAIALYKKAIQVNPKYSSAYNRLGAIYQQKAQQNPKNSKDYLLQAIQYYQQAVQYNSTFTIALGNMGVCLIKLGKYQQAYSLFSRAKKAMPYDNNRLSAQQRDFLTKQFQQFQKNQVRWKKTGNISDQQKQNLKRLIEQFQKKFSSISTAQKKIQVSTQKIFNPQVIDIIKIITEDKFQLNKISEIFQLVTQIFHEDQEYFHIIPLLVIQKFITQVFEKKKSIMQVQDSLRIIIKNISEIVYKKQGTKTLQNVKDIKVQLTECIPTNQSINLFKNATYFNSYLQLFAEITKINSQAKKSFSDFTLLVDEVRKKSNGIPGGLGTKIPIQQSQQFKVILRIMQKMFKKEIDRNRTNKIIQKIDSNLKKLTQVSLQIVVKEVTKGWTQQITEILQERAKNNVQTTFTISDLLRAKCIYNSVDDILRAVKVADSYCKTYGYQIIELDNRLNKPQTQDVVLKIKIKDAICQLQLAMKQDEVLFHLDHCVYEILRSPLGCIFGSYLFMSKQIKYPLTTNCKDISEKIENQSQDNILVKNCAQYVFKVLKANSNEQ